MRRLYPLFLLLVVALATFAPARQARADLAWRDGSIAETNTLNCITGSPEFGIGAYVGQLYDTTYASPYVGQLFYMRVIIGGLGAPCGGTYLDVQFVPPAGVTVNAPANYPVRCFYQSVNSNSFAEFGASQGCPQPPFGIGVNPQGSGYRIDRRQPGDNNPAWPLAQGAFFQFWIPVVSDRPLDGLQTSTNFYAPIHGIDGVFSEWVYPRQTVYVAPAPNVDRVFKSGFEL